MIIGDYQFKVRSVIRECDDSVTIRFKKPWFTKIPYKPGQYLTVILEIEGKTELRAYSLNTTSSVDKEMAITVKNVENGLVSKYMNEQIKPGDKINVLRPYGKFIYEPSNEYQNIVLFGAGSGITPLFSIIKSALHDSPKSKVILVYANKAADSIIFKNQLLALESEFRYRFNVLHILKIPDGNTERYSGRLNKDIIKDIFEKWNLKNVGNISFYICGPSGFMDMAIESLKQLNVAAENIHSERFTAPSKANIPESNVPALMEVREGKKNKYAQVIVKPKENILDALLNAGYILHYSCGNGICGSCKTHMPEGEVCMTLNIGLSEEDKLNRYILPCVSYPVTEKIKLHL